MIPDSVTSIGQRAFSGCSGLTSVTIPSSVSYVGEYAFNGCGNLTNIVVNAGTIADYAFEGCGDEAWVGNGIPLSLTIGESVTNIGTYAFWCCYGLTSVTIPSSVSYVGAYAFNRCDNLTNIVVNAGTIAYNAFAGCGDEAWEFNGIPLSLTIGESVTNIGTYAFWRCYGLRDLTIPANVTTIGRDAFLEVDVTNLFIDVEYVGGDGTFLRRPGYDVPLTVVLGDSVKHVGNFLSSYECIDNLTIGENVETIGEYAFGWCVGLKNVKIPDSVCDIGADAFFECDGLTSVTLGNGVTNIGAYAFGACDDLTSVTFGNGVANIDDWAFAYCTSLTNIVFEGNVPAIGTGCFTNANPSCTVYVKRGSTGWGVDIPGTWNGLAIKYMTPESKTVYVNIEKTTFAEGEDARISFTISEPYMDFEGNMLYAFIEPLNDDASNLTSSANWPILPDGSAGNGIRFDYSKTDTGGRFATIRMLDGPSNPLFGVRLCTSQSFDPAKEVFSYSSSPISVMVTNVCPWVYCLLCDNETVFEPGSCFYSPVYPGVSTEFEIDPSDCAPVFDIGGTDSNNCLIARWGFKGANDSEWTYVWKFYIGVNEYSNRCTHVFTEPNSTDNQIKVTLIDKDMRQPGDIYWVEDANHDQGGYWETKPSFDVDALPSFTAYVETTQPFVIVRPSLAYFTEADFSGNPENLYFDIGLTEAYQSGPLDVKFHIERMNDITGDNPGLLNVEEIVHRFNSRAGQIDTDPWRVYVNDIDGVRLTDSGQRGRFRLWAEVVSSGTPYGSVTNNAFVVRNSAPAFCDGSTIGGYVPNAETNTYVVPINRSLPVNWKVTDALNDLTNGLRVTISCPGGFATTSFVYNAFTQTDIIDAKRHAVTGTWNFGFTAPGLYQVRVAASDKDGGSVEKSWYFLASIPNEWLQTYPSVNAALDAGDVSAVLQATAANGRMSVADCYVVGVDPEKADEDFRITKFPMKADGTPDLANLEFEPTQDKWNVQGASPVIKGAAALGGEWQAVTDENKAGFRFFKVVVELP